MAVIGYMRVSTVHQKFDSQQEALNNYGITKIFKEQESGRKEDRTELNNAIRSLKKGDTFVVFKLDRLARNTKHLLSLIDEFEKKQINFVSIQNNIDTSTPMGKFFFTIMGAFSEMEADLTRERVLAGLDAARKKGKILGRPTLKKKTSHAIDLYQSTNWSVAKIAHECQLSVSTVYHHIQKNELSRKKNVLH